MTMKHSPGPWAVSRLATPDYAPEFGIFRDDPAGSPCLARTMNENSEANARLIAAAPELLAALQALVDCPDYRAIRTHEMRNARALLDSLT